MESSSNNIVSSIYIRTIYLLLIGCFLALIGCVTIYLGSVPIYFQETVLIFTRDQGARIGLLGVIFVFFALIKAAIKLY